MGSSPSNSKRVLDALLGLAVLAAIVVALALAGRHFGWDADTIEAAVVGAAILGAISFTYLQRRR